MWRRLHLEAETTTLSFLDGSRGMLRILLLLFFVSILESLALEPIGITSSTNLTTDGPIGIVIMAQGRSGSTMLGETFRQNKDVLYFFEPCRAWGQDVFESPGIYHRELVGHECSDLIRRLATCKFFMEDTARLAVDQAALEMGSPELEVLRSAVRDPTIETLARAHETILGGCKTKRAAVVKSIRADAGMHGIDDGISGIRVLHLVRDPRAVIHSQIKTFNVAHKYRRYFNPRNPSHANQPAPARDPAELVNGRMEGLTGLPWSSRQRAHVLGLIICGVYQEQLRSSAFLGANRYFLVRYEDITVSTKILVERVYHWCGLGDVPARVSLWIDENTRMEDCDEGGEKQAPDLGPNVPVGATHAIEVLDAANQPTALTGAQERFIGASGNNNMAKPSKCTTRTAERASWDRYGTRRHAKAMAGLWRTQMPRDEAEAVWEACRSSRVMETLGYKP